MTPLRFSARLALGLAVSTLVFAVPATAQSPTEDFHRAYYLQHEKGDLEGALALYEKVAASRRAPAELRDEATALARAVTEELACADFARLVPADAIFYAELNRPGAQLRSLLGQLGLLGAGGERFGISPALIEGALGMRGAAVAITEIDPRSGPQAGVAILHPGDLDVVRGLLETALPVGGRPEQPIDGHPTYGIEGEAYVTLTSRLMILGRRREDIAGVIARLQDGGRDSLAQSPAAAGAMAARGDDLLFFCLNLPPVMPMLMDAIRHEARRDPEALAALAFLDLPSARTVVGRVGVGENGLSLDLAVELAEGHRNLAFNLMRLPNLDEQALSLVPAGPAFFCVGAVNRRGAVPPGLADGEGRPVVTMMDFGRELFANVAEVAAFVMPDVQRAPWGPMPDVGLAMRVNDPERSWALWQFLLGMPQAVTGGQPSAPQQHGDLVVQRYEVEKVPLFLARSGNQLILTPSERLIGTAVEAAREGRSVLGDPAYAHALAHVGQGSTMVAAANLGRCAEIARHFMSDRERREMEPFAALMQGTTVSLGVLQTSNRLGVHGCVVGIPDVGPLVTDLIDREVHRGRPQRGRRPAPINGGTRAAVVPPPPPPAVTAREAHLEALRAQFEAAHTSGSAEEARAAAQAIGAHAAGDATLLNDFAWALLTEERYGGRYDDVAIGLSKTSNEASQWRNWYHLDTYARALFKAGSLEEAIAMQQKAVELAEGDPRSDEAKRSLAEYLAAARKRKIH